MKDVVDRTFQGDELRDVVLEKTELWVVAEVAEISLVPGDQVVHSQDLVTFLEKAIGQMGSEESGPARHHADWHPSGLESFQPQGKPTTGVGGASGPEFWQ